MEGDLTLDGEHRIYYTDVVLKNFTPETCNFINQCHPNIFNKIFSNPMS